MLISDENDSEINATAVALTLIRQFGEKAASLVQKQVDDCIGQPTASEHWRKVAAAIATLNVANLHMEIALDLLDLTGELSAAPSLNHAIVTLGIRKAEDQDRVDALAGIVSDSLRDHAEQRNLHDIQLSLSSRYAQLHRITGDNV